MNSAPTPTPQGTPLTPIISETPRTDRETWTEPSDAHSVVYADFARTLECELVTAQTEIDRLKHSHADRVGQQACDLERLSKMVATAQARASAAEAALASSEERVKSQNRAVNEGIERNLELEDQYSELLYAVATKYDGESRHDTALRYIRQAENKESGPAQDVRAAARPDAEKPTSA